MELGKYNELRLVRFVEFGAYLGDGSGSEVLLPLRYLTGEEAVGDTLRVFVYNDSEGRPVATTEEPHAVVGDIALLRVKAVNPVGAFLDWGLEAKDLLVPFSEQRVRMNAGRSYIVKLYVDNVTGRVAASAKLGKFLSKRFPDYYHRQKVDVLIVQQSEIGYKVIVDGRHWGMVYQSELYHEVNVGEHHMGFVKQVRDDGKIDVTLEKIEKMRVDDVAQRLLEHIRLNGGSTTLNDKSSPEEIMSTLSCSKKDFKKALGQLYKQQLIEIKPTVRLIVKKNKRNEQRKQRGGLKRPSQGDAKP